MKRFRRLAAVVPSLLLFLVGAACDDGSGPSVVATTLDLTGTELSLAEGDTARLSATVRDRFGELLESPPVSWSVSDPSIVAVDATGGLSARAPGEAYAIASLSRRGGAALVDSARVRVYALAASIQLIEEPREPRVSAEQTLAAPIRFRVLDRRGAPALGVPVVFAVVSGSGSVSPASATTDSLGIAATRFTTGHRGYQLFTATARGTQPAVFAVSAAAAARVVLSPDSVVIPAPGCSGGVLARIFTRSGREELGQIVQFRVVDSSVVDLSTAGRGGSYGGQSATIKGRRVGETDVIASYDGIADTARVWVTPERPARVHILWSDTMRLTRGNAGEPGVTAQVLNGCGVTLPNEPLAYRSLEPHILSVDASGKLRMLADGVARIVASSGAFADTLVAHVRSFVLLPADTTIRIGETVRYQVMTPDAAGNLVPFSGAAYYSSLEPRPLSSLPGSVTKRDEQLFTAHAVGEGVVYAYTSPPVSGWFVGHSKLRIVEPPPSAARKP